MASFRHQRRKGCEGKIRHANQFVAIVAARHTRGIGLGVYKCGFCRGWHVGHTPGELRRLLARIRES